MAVCWQPPASGQASVVHASPSSQAVLDGTQMPPTQSWPPHTPSGGQSVAEPHSMHDSLTATCVQECVLGSQASVVHRSWSLQSASPVQQPGTAVATQPTLGSQASTVQSLWSSQSVASPTLHWPPLQAAVGWQASPQ